MPTIIGNPYQKQSSLGDTIAALGKSMFGDTLTPAIRREQLYALQRKNVETNALMNAINNGDIDLTEAAKAGVGAGYDPQNLGELARVLAANKYGATSPQATNAFFGAGGAYENTAPGMEAKLATQRYGYDVNARQSGLNNTQDNETRVRIAGMKPEAVLGPNGPTFATVGTLNTPGAGGYTPVLSEADRKGTILAGLPQNDQRTAVLGAQAFEPTETILGQNGPQIVPRTQSYGQTPVLGTDQVKGVELARAMPTFTDQQRNRVLGAESLQSPTPRNYLAPNGERFLTYDGQTDVNGRPLPPGGLIVNAQGTPEQSGLRPNVQGNLQSAQIAGQKFQGMMNYARTLIQEDRVGASGWMKQLAQDGGQLAGNVAAGLGYNGLNEAIAQMQQKAQQSGVSPGVLQGLFTFDSGLPKLHAAYDMLVFSGAEALANQSGRSVTDRDVERFKKVFGDPNSLFANPQSLNARLDAAQEMLDMMQEVNGNALGGRVAPAAPGVPAPQPTAPAAPAPVAAPDPLGIR